MSRGATRAVCTWMIVSSCTCKKGQPREQARPGKARGEPQNGQQSESALPEPRVVGGGLPASYPNTLSMNPTFNLLHRNACKKSGKLLA